MRAPTLHKVLESRRLELRGGSGYGGYVVILDRGERVFVGEEDEAWAWLRSPAAPGWLECPCGGAPSVPDPATFGGVPWDCDMCHGSGRVDAHCSRCESPEVTESDISRYHDDEEPVLCWACRGRDEIGEWDSESEAWGVAVRVEASTMEAVALIRDALVEAHDAGRRLCEHPHCPAYEDPHRCAYPTCERERSGRSVLCIEHAMAAERGIRAAEEAAE